MSSIFKSVTPVLAFALLGQGCGGSGSGGAALDPFNTQSYAEYTDGDDLSGIWMMVVNAEYDYETETGEIRQGSTKARSTLFLREYDGSTTGLGMSNPFCTPTMFDRTSYEVSGSTITLDTAGNRFNLTIDSNSHISGTIDATYATSVHVGDCGLGEICLVKSNITAITSDVQLKKVAPLPTPYGEYHFEAERPSLGNISGELQTQHYDNIELAFESVSCLAQIVTDGERLISPSPYLPIQPINNEEIIVNYGAASVLLVSRNKDAGDIYIENVEFEPYNSGALRNFQYGNFAGGTITTTGANPSTIIIEPTPIYDATSDASSDATSDAFEINLDI